MKSWLILVACVAYCQATAVDPCASGPTFWCNSLQNAKACNSIQHCSTQTWRNNIVKQDDSEVCTFCKTIIGEVKTMIVKSSTQDEIRAYLEAACKVIPDATMSSECKNVVDQYLPEVLDLIAAEMDPQMVCSLLNLCSSELSDQPAVVQSPVQVEPLCTDCKKFVDDFKQFVTNPDNEKQIEDMIDNTVCTLLGALEDECRQLVHTYIPEALQFVASFIDSDMVCQALGVCAADVKAARAKLFAVLRTPHSPAVIQSSEGCTICQTAVAEIKSLITDTSVQTSIENFIKEEICARLGSTKDTCDNYVDSYGPIVFNLLAEELDPQTTCQMLGFCSAELSVVSAIRKNSLVMPMTVVKQSAVQTQKPIYGSTGCTLCTLVVKELDGLLENNATEEEIIAALEKVCSLLPSSIASECDDFIQMYGKALIQLLEQEASPDVVCSVLGLCSSTKVNKPVVQISSPQLCGVCETVIQYVDTLIETNATEKEIEAVLDKVCNFLPETLRDECEALVQQYGPMLVKLLEQELDPREVCTRLGLCSSNAVKPAVQVGSSGLCEVCQTVMQYVDSMLEANATEKDIEEVLDKVCNILPQSFRAECDSLVQQYGPMIIHLLVQGLDPQTVCTELGLCGSNIVKPVAVQSTSEVCGLCETVIQAIDSALEDNRTVAAIEKEMNKVCSLLPKADEQVMCHLFVQEYGSQIAQLIAQYADPKEICQNIGLCSMLDEQHANEIQPIKPTKPVLGANECTYGPAYWCASKENAAKCKAVVHCQQHVWN